MLSILLTFALAADAPTLSAMIRPDALEDGYAGLAWGEACAGSALLEPSKKAPELVYPEETLDGTYQAQDFGWGREGFASYAYAGAVKFQRDLGKVRVEFHCLDDQLFQIRWVASNGGSDLTTPFSRTYGGQTGRMLARVDVQPAHMGLMWRRGDYRVVSSWWTYGNVDGKSRSEVVVTHTPPLDAE